MIVWLVMRGTEFYGVFATEDLAQQVAQRYNDQMPRGKRYVVEPVPVRGTEGDSK